jgi:ADP-ribose pyrophosphatase YjhB (NUDIX family)
MHLPEKYVCSCGKCGCVTARYVPDKIKYTKRSNKKVGAFIQDNKSLLLVQSCGKHWGPPKGTMEDNESVRECAIREVYEETGIDVSHILPKEYTRLKSRFYYYTITYSHDIGRWRYTRGNDASGIGWFTIDCLVRNIINTSISVNQHLRAGLEKFYAIKIEDVMQLGSKCISSTG